MTRHTLRAAVALLALTCGGGIVTRAVAAPQPYVRQDTTCDGFPRVAVGMAPGYCAGLVFAPFGDDFRHRQVKTPRMLLQLPDGKHWVLTDLGAWTAGLGALWMLDATHPKEVRVESIMTGRSEERRVGKEC